MKVSMLTTIDNPFDPFNQFDEWLAYDTDKGHHTCAYLARITRSSDQLSDNDEVLAIEEAIDEIVKMNVIGLYRKVTAEQEDLAVDPFEDVMKAVR